MAGGMFGYRPNDLLMQGLMAKARAPASRGSLQNYRPTLGERVTDFARSKLLGAGVKPRIASRLANLVEFSPVGVATAALQTGADLRQRNYRSAAVNGISSALNAVPDLGPAAKAMFLGVMAKNADKIALRKAEQMAAKGADRNQIWNETGWFQGVDGKWRFEIDDSASTLRSHPAEGGREIWGKPFPHVEQPSPFMAARGVQPISYEGVLQHPQLQAAYGAEAFNPHISWKLRDDLADVDARGHLDMRNNRIEGFGGPGLGPVHHELQHSVQGHEGFARGGSPEEFGGSYQDYKRLAGEVEARNVETRLNWTPEQRRLTPPWLSQDTPDEKQIVNFDLLRALSGR